MKNKNKRDVAHLYIERRWWGALIRPSSTCCRAPLVGLNGLNESGGPRYQNQQVTDLQNNHQVFCALPDNDFNQVKKKEK